MFATLDKEHKETPNFNTPEGMNNIAPIFLTHPYAQIACTNKGELLYILEWAKNNGKHVADFYYKIGKFPLYLFLSSNIVGWTDSADRIGEKFSFSEFVNSINWV